jgi:hypothetical protein
MMKNFRYNLVIVQVMLFIGIGLCHAQKLPCESQVRIQLDKITRADKRSNVIEKSKAESFIVKFMSEFNDSIQGYVNNRLEFADFVSTNKITGETNKVFGYDYSGASAKLTLKFISTTKNSCCCVALNKKYKIVYVFLDAAGKWIVRFSNVHYISTRSKSNYTFGLTFNSYSRENSTE